MNYELKKRCKEAAVPHLMAPFRNLNRGAEKIHGILNQDS
jgi:hypothetical protein